MVLDQPYIAVAYRITCAGQEPFPLKAILARIAEQKAFALYDIHLLSFTKDEIIFAIPQSAYACLCDLIHGISFLVAREIKKLPVTVDERVVTG